MWRLILFLNFCLISLVSLAASPSVRTMPMLVGDHQTIWLACGQTYSGELKLIQASQVTIRTAGTCGKATLTPAVPVSGWSRDPQQPQIWVAAFPSRPLQYQLDDVFITEAHHPNHEDRWLKGKRVSPLQLNTDLPNHDLSNATIVWRANEWLIQNRAIAAYQAGDLILQPGDDDGFGLPMETEFYLEGKRWMLDSPGEWAWQNGLLSVWPADGKSPEGRAWATVGTRAIDARGSRDVAIIGVRIVGAVIGIDGSGSENLHIRDTDIFNSGEEALVLGSGAQVQRINVRGSRQHGLRADQDAKDILISDSRFVDIGMLGMPRRSKGAIVFESAQAVVVERNHISSAAYLGIRVFRNARVSDNMIERACLRLTDCGGIYTFARDRQRLNTVIEGNQIKHLTGRSAYGIYLDDFANGVRVEGNQIENNDGGIELHNGFDNDIISNRFINNRHEQILFNETAPFASIGGNQIHDNIFISTKDAPVYRLWSRHGGTYVRRFADFSGNDYTNPPNPFAEVAGMGMLDISAWRTRIADTRDSSLPVFARPPKLER
ncbi:MAG: hypothetical protein RL369_483 [Pseudomonadota bacterium]